MSHPNRSDHREPARHWSSPERDILKKICTRAGVNGQVVYHDMNTVQFIGRGRFTICVIITRLHHTYYGVCMYLPGERNPFDLRIGKVNAFVKACRDIVSAYKVEKVTKRISA